MSVVNYAKLAALNDAHVGLVDHVKLAEYDHQYYVQHRAAIQSRNQRWRVTHQAKIEKQRKKYKKQLKMGRKPRERHGGNGAAYTFTSRGGMDFSKHKRI